MLAGMGRPCLVILLLLLVASGASGQGTQADRREAIQTLLAALKSAPSEQAAAPIEARLTQLWLDQGSAAVTLLMARGLRDMKAGAHDEAVEDFGDAIALDPGLPEPWHQRAIARFLAGDQTGGIHDVEETLKREPRHFGAFDTLSRIAESRKDWKGAYAAWQKVLEIDPKAAGGTQRLADLRRRALGEQT